MVRRGKKGQAGFIVSAEIIFILTIMICCVAIGWSSISAKIIGEIGDLGSAIGSLNQSYSMSGMAVGHPTDPVHPTDIAFWRGSSFEDHQDFCDQGGTCGVRMCIPPAPECTPLPTP
ncbi:MAG: hypothetical protein ABJC13_00850 [Acidobacteriota bacterium]